MKKVSVLILVVFSVAIASAAFAGDRGENMVGSLFLFQKCDSSLIPDEEAENPLYDSNGCPVPGNGPWPIFSENRRWGQMKYNLLGDNFRFSFQGKRLLPETDYTLIYYPDEWPGKGLICLGSSTSNPNGNLQIGGSLEILTGLPAPYDKNFNPVEPSGITGAKIWLVRSVDVQCEGVGDVDPETGLQSDPPQMIGWDPASYLFEGNPIVYQYTKPIDDTDDDSGFENVASRKSKPTPSDNGKNDLSNGRSKNR
ncbi:MAG: hypothetical protein JXA73_24255 [Acidobacteria bacterium]|nr:hypothetical protein [Acidobacteriota bacterium]